MAEVTDLEKTQPILLLENRRQHLLKWLSEGEEIIKAAEREIKDTQKRGLDILSELEAIERALNVLNAAQEKVDG